VVQNIAKKTATAQVLKPEQHQALTNNIEKVNTNARKHGIDIESQAVVEETSEGIVIRNKLAGETASSASADTTTYLSSELYHYGNRRTEE